MPTLSRFEDLEVWKTAREFVQEVHRITRVGLFSKDYPLCNQIRRASISIMANIAEGFERDGNAEFVQFLFIARASSGETQALLYIALDQGYLNETLFARLHEKSGRINRKLAGFISYLCKSKMKGAKYK